MTLLICAVCLLCIGFAFGYLIGKEHGVIEGKAVGQLKQAFERPMKRRG